MKKASTTIRVSPEIMKWLKDKKTHSRASYNEVLENIRKWEE